MSDPENDQRGPLDIVRAFTTTTAQKPPLTETRRIVLGDGYHALSLDGGYFSLQLSVALDKVEKSAGIQQGSFTYEGRSINLGDPEPEVWVDDKIAVVLTGTQRLSPDREVLGRSVSIFTLFLVDAAWKLAGAASTQSPLQGPSPSISTDLAGELSETIERLKTVNQARRLEDSAKLLLHKAGGSWLDEKGAPQHSLLEDHVTGPNGWSGIELKELREEVFDDLKVRVSDATALVWARITARLVNSEERRGTGIFTLYKVDGTWLVAHSAVYIRGT